ncbi:MAG: lysophospholipid acyltransferase family protein [Dehalococcoidia bacterium]
MQLRSLFELGVRGLGAVPHEVGPGIAAILGRMGYGGYWSERQLAGWNLAYCYPDRSPAWRRWVAIQFFEHIVISAYEVFHAVSDPAGTEARVTIEHGERLAEAIALGRGVVVATGHYGNFALLPFILRNASPDPAYIARASKRKVGPLVQAARNFYRASLKPIAGMHVLPSSLGGVLMAKRLLIQGNLLVVFSDLTWGVGGVPVTLMGVPHEVSRAPAALALHTGAVLLPVITRRTRDGRQLVTIERPIPPAEARSARARETLMMERFTAILETYVRAEPAQWYWLHRSWRTNEFKVQSSKFKATGPERVRGLQVSGMQCFWGGIAFRQASGQTSLTRGTIGENPAQRRPQLGTEKQER